MYGLLKIWLNIGIFRQNEIGLVFGFCGGHFIGIGLVLVCHFPENDISTTHYTITLVESTPFHLISAHLN